MSLSTKPQVRRINLILAAIIIIIAGTVGIVGALLSLSVPSTPGITAPNGGAVTSSVCGGSLVNLGTAPFPSSGMMRYTCDSTHGAFSVDIVGVDKPTFTLPGNYTGLAYIPKSATSCQGPGLTTLTSGTPTTFTLSTDYDLCASYTSTTGGTLPGFTVQWSS